MKITEHILAVAKNLQDIAVTMRMYHNCAMDIKHIQTQHLQLNERSERRQIDAHEIMMKVWAMTLEKEERNKRIEKENEERMKEFLKSPIPAPVKKVFVCVDCEDEFDTLELLRSHLKGN